ncbi:hypothetical protein [Bradyrhizobium sp. CB3481]|uniref:hypothetical protein n=1 Tax=Bradyrhizobium sp. CB3481 TaxID=3039158 RepID=UPI0024B231D4|nr:hypothetical protein [Bradyrhizobium sp. CB3481]WFU20127.1 hypothetical protein QA643_18240 [Bradyrhizobium sp. CB3481]
MALVLADILAADLGMAAQRVLEWPHGLISWPAGAAKSIADEIERVAVTGPAQGARIGTKLYPRLQEYPSHGDQIRASDRDA